MTHRCAALEEQRTWRDLRQLGQGSDRNWPTVRWVNADQASTAP